MGLLVLPENSCSHRIPALLQLHRLYIPSHRLCWYSCRSEYDLFEPDRITLSLLIGESSDKKVAIKSSDKTTKTKSQIQKQAVVTYLTEKITAKTTEIAELLGVKDARARRLLAEMVAEGTIVTEGENRNRVYKLKA